METLPEALWLLVPMLFLVSGSGHLPGHVTVPPGLQVLFGWVALQTWLLSLSSFPSHGPLVRLEGGAGRREWAQGARSPASAGFLLIAFCFVH